MNGTHVFFHFFLGGPLYDPFLYNCSGTSPWTVSKIPIGIVYATIGTVSQTLYVSLLFSLFHTKSLFRLPCYKIMFFMGFSDTLCLIICADFAGIYSIFGVHPCFAISFTYVTGCFVFGLWHMSCCFVLILAFNRTCEVVAPGKCVFLFERNFFKGLIGLPILYFFYITFFTKPSFFQSEVSAFLLNPMSAVTKTFPNHYYTVNAYVFNNIFVIFFIGVSYFIICTKLIHQSWTSKSKQTSELVRRVSYQIMILCSCHSIGCSLYVYIQYFPMPDFLNYVCHLAWIGNHSLPPYVYIVFNPTIRKDILRIFCPRIHARKNRKVHFDTTTATFQLAIMPSLT